MIAGISRALQYFVFTATLLILSVSQNAFSGGQGISLKSSDAVPVFVSDNQQYVLISNPFGQGLTLVDTSNGSSTIITEGKSVAQGASVSGDGKYVCYKSFSGSNQIPTLYVIASGKTVELDHSALAGTPAGSQSGQVAYTSGNELRILDGSLSVTGAYDLGMHVNLLSFSADGKSIAHNNADDQIVVVNLATGSSNVVTDGKASYFAPKFNARGDRVLASTVTGDVAIADAKRGKVKNLGKGEAAGWLSNNTVAITRKSIVGTAVASTDVFQVNSNGKGLKKLHSISGDAAAAAGGGKIAVSGQGSGNGALKVGNVKRGGADLIDLSGVKLAKTVTTSPDDKIVVNGSTTVELSGVPYIHQNNDTPDYWNGNSSCGATSALMAINYFNIMPKHPITASWPTPHTSDYGWYIPEVYTFNGHTYNKPSQDQSGRTGWGGFGYITQNGWEDTKTHMSEYISYHGPTSGVDWSPSMAKARTETDGNKPFVLLNSLTAAGHYICCIGYVKNQNTLIFNDPYGNKNTGSYPSSNGRQARYDWPGYNNGYINLNTVHCYIYCRFGQPSAPSGAAATAVSSTQINLTWTDNSSCEANNEVWRSSTSGGPYTLIATLGANATSYSNTGLTAGTTYHYVIKASNASGSSPNSNQASATTSGGGVPDQIVDNSSSGFTASANWSTGTSASDKYGTNYRFRSTQAISDAAVWTFNITVAGNYEVYAWWSAGSNRSTAAGFILPDNTTVSRNQQTNGGMWNSLGIKNLPVGTATVKLSCWTTTGFIVLADAVKLVKR